MSNENQVPTMPNGYTIETDGVSYAGTPKYAVLLNGERIDTGWFAEETDAIADAWGHSYGQIAEKLNNLRPDEWDHVVGWKLPNEGVYAVDHLKFYTPATRIVVNRYTDEEEEVPYLTEITLAENSQYQDDSKWYIANLLCCCGCGEGVVDLEVLSEHGLALNDDGDDEEEDEE